MAHRIGVILFPGSNCELEALRACRRSHLETELFRWNDDYSKLKNYDAYILPGGFSYEDRGRSGIIASKDPLMSIIKKEGLQGKPVLGLCNGAQILVETDLIPGLNGNNLEMALAWNERVKKGKILGIGFYNDWVYMRSDAKPGRSIFNRFSQKVVMRIPVAHGEGRFTTQDKTLLKKLIDNQQTLFRYCDEKGQITPEFPVNPNAAMYNLAGVCNLEGNILALMPHPERTINGQPIYDSLADYLKSSKKVHFSPKKIEPKTKQLPEIKDIALRSVEIRTSHVIEKLKKKPDITILIKLIITDNEERTIENTLKRLGYNDIKLQRKIFLGFYLKNKKNMTKTAEKLLKSGELLNLNKEIPTIFIGKKVYTFTKEKGLLETENPLPPAFHFYVSEFDNYTGKSIHANLQQHLGENTIEKIERGVFWTLQVKDSKKVDEIIQTHIFHNPHSMKLVQI